MKILLLSNGMILKDRILNEQVKKRGYSDLYEKEYIRKDGTIFPIEITDLCYQ